MDLNLKTQDVLRFFHYFTLFALSGANLLYYNEILSHLASARESYLTRLFCEYLSPQSARMKLKQYLSQEQSVIIEREDHLLLLPLVKYKQKLYIDYCHIGALFRQTLRDLDCDPYQKHHRYFQRLAPCQRILESTSTFNKFAPQNISQNGIASLTVLSDGLPSFVRESKTQANRAPFQIRGFPMSKDCFQALKDLLCFLKDYEATKLFQQWSQRFQSCSVLTLEDWKSCFNSFKRNQSTVIGQAALKLLYTFQQVLTQGEKGEGFLSQQRIHSILSNNSRNLLGLQLQIPEMTALLRKQGILPPGLGTEDLRIISNLKGIQLQKEVTIEAEEVGTVLKSIIGKVYLKSEWRGIYSLAEEIHLFQESMHLSQEERTNRLKEVADMSLHEEQEDERKALLAEFESKIGYSFKQKLLLELAFTGRKVARFSKLCEWLGGNYEMLEYLGDAVLGLYLAQSHQYRDIGYLSSNDHLHNLALKMSLLKYTVLDPLTEKTLIKQLSLKAGGKRSMKLLADIFEAVAGAVMLDSLDLTQTFSVLELMVKIEKE